MYSSKTRCATGLDGLASLRSHKAEVQWMAALNAAAARVTATQLEKAAAALEEAKNARPTRKPKQPRVATVARAIGKLSLKDRAALFEQFPPPALSTPPRPTVTLPPPTQ